MSRVSKRTRSAREGAEGSGELGVGRESRRVWKRVMSSWVRGLVVDGKVGEKGSFLEGLVGEEG